MPIHTPPITTFWSEWWAGALGLAAVITGLLAIRGRTLNLPWVLGIPAVLLLALVLQFATGRVTFPQVGLLYASYLLWSGMLIILGRYLVETIGFARFAGVVASAFVAGALIGSGIALMQWLGLSQGIEWVIPRSGTTAFANLGQANHHAHYSWLGITSAFYLRGRGALSRPALWLLILPMASGSVLSGSRSVFLYSVILLAAAAYFQRRHAEGHAVSFFRDAFLLLPVVVALSFFAAWAAQFIPEASGDSTAGARIFAAVAGPSARIELARSAWAAFLEYPWLGQGAGSYPWGAFVAASNHVGDPPYAVSENAHNLILQLMSELGGPATVLSFALLGLWAKRFFSAAWGLEQFWCGALLSIGAAHALFEYPLWHAYFLGPAALLLGATDSGKAMTLPARRATVYVALISLLGVSILASLRSDYRIIEDISIRPLAAHSDRERAWRISMDRLLVLYKDSLLSPWALRAFTNVVEPNRLQAQDRADLCQRGIRFSPYRQLVARCAMQLAIAGRDAEAEKLALMALRAYPAQSQLTMDEFAKEAKQYPEIKPLLRLGSQK
ncbi:MAG: Wzy polymerase domain-containing protein [Sulfuritalea sp.]|nr:Wzy polymerase domain-containing protein [Sulfuritalea sp.]